MNSFAGCFCLKKARQKRGFEDPIILASETPFTLNEVEALYDLFKKLSSSIVDDDLIHKEEFQLALFESSTKQNLFADRVFDLFDVKHNGFIAFGEFVRALSVFHPSAPKEDKVACMILYITTGKHAFFFLKLVFAFRLYDLRQTGYIEREEVKEMILAILSESELTLANDVVESILDKTMLEADTNGDGKIDIEEWKEYVAKNPNILKIMTLPHLKEITLSFPSFVLHSEGQDLK
ncbi:hypothetical protein Pint_14910 [Pistacia integerrima]|uniref:Uncharacterized protein n=1 Tax=Pistacia integerrima TaxID=434235 RepID=A0ACC0ZA53_9ROSI|nr:hypothetical protein Pint_14910 [Pistacia integerrima]